jgi:hypothetical protein
MGTNVSEKPAASIFKGITSQNTTVLIFNTVGTSKLIQVLPYLFGEIGVKCVVYSLCPGNFLPVHHLKVPDVCNTHGV